jgi:hypothetical protein
MKHVFPQTVGFALLIGLAQFTPRAAAPAGYVDFGKLSPADSKSEFVEVNVNSNLISMVAKLTQKAEPDVAQLLQGLHAIRVNVIGLTDENREDVGNRIKAIRAQLDTQGWERIVTVQEKKQDVGVYLKTRSEEAVEGIVVTVLDGKKEAVLVNVVGDIKPEQLALLGERFHIDPLKKVGHSLEKKAPAKDE